MRQQARGVQQAARKIVSLFGTRPEAIKMAPVIAALSADPARFTPVNVCSSQHTDLLRPLIDTFTLKVHHDLHVMQPNQTLSSLAARVLAALDPILQAEQPDLLLVQGDTTTALCGALAAFHRRVPVGHVEAGLRSGDPHSPFPEEANRRLITRIASLHFAATENNRQQLLNEDVDAGSIFVTGNTVVDALEQIRLTAEPTAATRQLLAETTGQRRILLTTHRRESFGDRMGENLRVLREFLAAQPDVALIFPVHPNPAVTNAARAAFADCPRVHLTPPMDYSQFVLLMSHAWLIVSDSGGVQEEAPSLGRPLLVLRENTERPEAIAAGCAKLAATPQLLAEYLLEATQPNSWTRSVAAIDNPFGDGHAARRIVAAIAQHLGLAAPKRQAVLA